MLLLRAKGVGRGDGQGQGERAGRGAADPSATGVRWAEGGVGHEGQREGRRQRARPRAGRVTHGLSEGLKGGSGRDLHAGLLPSGYALPPEAMICKRKRRFAGKMINLEGGAGTGSSGCEAEIKQDTNRKIKAFIDNKTNAQMLLSHNRKLRIIKNISSFHRGYQTEIKP